LLGGGAGVGIGGGCLREGKRCELGVCKMGGGQVGWDGVGWVPEIVRDLLMGLARGMRMDVVRLGIERSGVVVVFVMASFKEIPWEIEEMFFRGTSRSWETRHATLA